MSEWIRTANASPADGAIVDTKIDDMGGVRNEQPLKKQGNLWWTRDGEMYVYYTPTHWRPRP